MTGEVVETNQELVDNPGTVSPSQQTVWGKMTHVATESSHGVMVSRICYSAAAQLEIVMLQSVAGQQVPLRQWLAHEGQNVGQLAAGQPHGHRRLQIRV